MVMGGILVIFPLSFLCSIYYCFIVKYVLHEYLRYLPVVSRLFLLYI